MLVTYRLSIAVLSAMPPKPSHRQNQDIHNNLIGHAILREISKIAI